MADDKETLDLKNLSADAMKQLRRDLSKMTQNFLSGVHDIGKAVKDYADANKQSTELISKSLLTRSDIDSKKIVDTLRQTSGTLNELLEQSLKAESRVSADFKKDILSSATTVQELYTKAMTNVAAIGTKAFDPKLFLPDCCNWFARHR